jgi:ketosteroid isomerase-like protein
LNAGLILEQFFAAIVAGQLERLSELLHPEAEIHLLAFGSETVRGREAVVSKIRTVREETVYEPTVHRVEESDERIAIAVGSSRYPLDFGGFAVSQVVWVAEIEDGTVRQVRTYLDMDAAQAAAADVRAPATGASSGRAEGR